MPSNALLSLLTGIQEVRDLQHANPTPPGGMPSRPQVVRAINRSSVVLLASHLERYLRALNEEAVGAVNRTAVPGTVLPEGLRLQHSRVPIEDMLETQWDNRATQLGSFVLQDSWLWGNAPKGDLAADRLLQWMRSPFPERIMRFFALWGVVDVFGEVTRRSHTRARLWLKLKELIEKRNNIAHGDATTGATYQDIASYLSVVWEFCKRADKVLGRAVGQHLRAAPPW